jgi:hypothetical protein
MRDETDAEFLERMKHRRGFPTRDDVVRMDRIRREGGGGSGRAGTPDIDRHRRM